MSICAQIAIQTGPEEWAYVYIHYDGYPSHMLAALSRWMPEDIFAAREIRQVCVDKLDAFDPPRALRILPLFTCEICHLYIWKDAGWVEHSNVVAAKAETD